MKNKLIIFLLAIMFIGCAAFVAYQKIKTNDYEKILFTTINPTVQKINFYWNNSQGNPIGSIGKLKTQVEKEGKTLLFAMNGGMFNRDFSPQGLYIENFKMLANIDTGSGEGNFYLKPNGIFYLTDKKQAIICTTPDFVLNKNIKYATQSGPMLLVDGVIHPAFKEGSNNLNIRNGVGVLPNNQVVFAMSKEEINFYDFAAFFQKMGCKNALYLDGFVSRAYLPEKNWIQTDGRFGVMIAVIQ
jgi:uncharacterized protein YigE (DUF2233 family)